MSDPFSQPSTWDLVAPGYAAGSVEHFENYAADAIAHARLAVGDRIIDVATGPGSLALLASKQTSRVDALDFSKEMIGQLEARVRASSIANVFAHHGDGQSLPFDDNSFDAGFSMFGLIFFPDRAAGFSELFRVLKPGGRCVVASWQPMRTLEAFVALFDALYAELPELPQDAPAAPLAERDALNAEMTAAGFDVEVHPTAHSLKADTVDEFWDGIRKAFAPIVLLENDMGTAAFDPIARGIRDRLADRLGSGPVSVEMSAWLGVARKPQ